MHNTMLEEYFVIRNNDTAAPDYLSRCSPLFLGEDTFWVSDPNHAQHFTSSEEANYRAMDLYLDDQITDYAIDSFIRPVESASSVPVTADSLKGRLGDAAHMLEFLQDEWDDLREKRIKLERVIDIAAGAVDQLELAIRQFNDV